MMPLSQDVQTNGAAKQTPNAAFTMVPIMRIRDENPYTKTFFSRHSLNAKPGQFVMLWQPGVDEKPMSVAFSDWHSEMAGKPPKKTGEFGLTVAKVGPSTEHLFNLKKGDRVGVRGPYGTHYELKKNYKRVAMVGGGFGSAPLRYLSEQAVSMGIHVDFIQGARSSDRLILQKDIQKLGAHLHVATNDGSEGIKGLVTDVLETLLTKNKYDAVYTCGPELMMQAVGKLSESHGVPCQVSVERYMKCGFGVCGQCDCGGMLTCVEGPVVWYSDIKKNPEFGVFHRDGSGQKHYFK